MFEITVKGDVASAHVLKGYDGPCSRLHGHTWKVEVTVESGVLDEIGMVVDFRILKEKLKEVLGPLDHVLLNDLPAFRTQNPTTENLAKLIYSEFAKAVFPLKVKNVRVWESELTSIIYYE